MEQDIDRALRRMARAEHPALDGVEDAVLRRIRADSTIAGAGWGAAGLAAMAAITLGILTSGPVAAPASAAPLDPLGATGPLAPSTLLAGQ